MITRLLQLASPALPVGAFSYSQGLEWAVQALIVRDAESARRWLASALEANFGSFEAPVWWRMYRAWQSADALELKRWNDEFIAARETGELREETRQMGHSLARLAGELNVPGAEILHGFGTLSFPLVHSFLAHAWAIDAHTGLTAYCWSWLENLVMAAVKTVPLGQSAAQRLLLDLGDSIEAIARSAAELEDHELSNYAPMLAISSCQHEAQYSRLFRS